MTSELLVVNSGPTRISGATYTAADYDGLGLIHHTSPNPAPSMRPSLLQVNSFGCGSSRGTRARFGGVERGRSERADGPQLRASLSATMRTERGIRSVGPRPDQPRTPNAIDQYHSDGAKPSIHDANTPNGEKTTRPSAQNQPAARRNAITPSEPHPTYSSRIRFALTDDSPSLGERKRHDRRRSRTECRVHDERVAVALRVNHG